MGPTQSIAAAPVYSGRLAILRMLTLVGFILIASVASPITTRSAEENKERVSSPGIKTEDLTDLPLETLMGMEVPTVYSASKFEQKTTEAPSSISIVTTEEIKRYGYRTLADVLRS